jgi:hypothetical protein
MHHVFVSYSRRDLPVIEPFLQLLREAGVRYWHDRTDLPLSISWIGEIRDAIQESILVVGCDSEHWRASEPCEAERRLATEVGIPTVLVSVASGPDAMAMTVIEEFRAVPDAARALADLRIATRTWVEQSRRASLLVGGRTARRWRQVAGKEIAEPELSFLRLSARRSRRQRVVLLLGLLLLITAYAVPASIKRIAKYQEAVNEQVSQRILEVDRAASDVTHDPYGVLSAAGASGYGDAGLDGERLSYALTAVVPDDAFTVPAGVRFTDLVVGREIVVQKGSRTWSREAAASAVRMASRSSRAAALGGVAHTSVSSPDGLEVAEANSDGVLIRSAHSRSVLVTLAGAAAPVTDVSWSAAGDRVWAVAGTKVVTWQRRQAHRLLRAPGTTWVSLLPLADPSVVLAVSSDGLLDHVSVATGQRTLVARVPEKVQIAAGGADAVVLTGTAHYFLYRPRSHRVAALHIAGCEPVVGTAAVTADGTEVVVGCDGERVVRADTTTGDVHGEANLPDQVRAVGQLPDGDVLVATQFGHVYQSPRATMRFRQIDEPTCKPGILGFAMTHDGSRLAPYGTGTGRANCSDVGQRGGTKNAGWNWYHYAEASEESSGSKGAAFTSDGRDFALLIGCDIVLHPSYLLPEVTVPVCSDLATALMTLPDDEALVAASDGSIFVQPSLQQELNNTSAGRLVARRLDRARELGLTDLRATRPAPRPVIKP